MLVLNENFLIISEFIFEILENLEGSPPEMHQTSVVINIK
jgi:hypothetical protein